MSLCWGMSACVLRGKFIRRIYDVKCPGSLVNINTLTCTLIKISNFQLVKDQCRLDIRKHSFSQRTINEWNKLSTDCVTASSVNMFKNKVDTYLRRAGYK